MANKKCPQCAETIKREAVVCRFCGHQFPVEEKAPPSNRDAAARFVVLLIAVVLVGQCTLGKSKTDIAHGSAADVAKAQKTADDKRKGFHCLSAWDGSSSQAIDVLKATLRDPDSFKMVETRITPITKGKHVLTMSYRAKNGFGGMNAGIAIFSIDHESCAATLVSNTN